MSTIRCVQNAQRKMEWLHYLQPVRNGLEARLIRIIRKCVEKIKTALPAAKSQELQFAGRVIRLCNQNKNNLASFQQAIQQLPFLGPKKQPLSSLMLNVSFKKKIVPWVIAQEIESNECKLADEIYAQKEQHPDFSEEAFLKGGLETALQSLISPSKNCIITFYRQKIERSSWMKNALSPASTWIVKQLTEGNDLTGDRTNHLIECLQELRKERIQENGQSLLTVTVRAILRTKNYKNAFAELLNMYLPKKSDMNRMAQPLSIDS